VVSRGNYFGALCIAWLWFISADVFSRSPFAIGHLKKKPKKIGEWTVVKGCWIRTQPEALRNTYASLHSPPFLSVWISILQIIERGCHADRFLKVDEVDTLSQQHLCPLVARPAVSTTNRTNKYATPSHPSIHDLEPKFLYWFKIENSSDILHGFLSPMYLYIWLSIIVSSHLFFEFLLTYRHFQSGMTQCRFICLETAFDLYGPLE
jgi:hypothetical protein